MEGLFSRSLQCQNPVVETSVEDLDPAPCNELAAPEILAEEVEAALGKMKMGKAPGIDNVSAEELKAATEALGTEVLHHLFQKIWEEKQISDDWKKAIITPIYKKDRLDCNNYRGISLLRHCCKLFTSVLMQRLRQRTDEIISEEQAGFRPDRSTVDQFFMLRLLAEKQRPICMQHGLQEGVWLHVEERTMGSSKVRWLPNESG